MLRPLARLGEILGELWITVKSQFPLRIHQSVHEMVSIIDRSPPVAAPVQSHSPLARQSEPTSSANELVSSFRKVVSVSVLL
jgi:hypothetical protein